MSPVTPFDFDDYKLFVSAWVKAQRSGGRGQFRAMAAHLRVHSTMISQVFRGERELTPEQSVQLAEYLALPAGDTEYFVDLVAKRRATSEGLRALIERRLRAQKQEHLKLQNRLAGRVRILGKEAQARFYSQWFYSAVRLAAGIGAGQTAASLAALLDLPVALVDEITGFLADQQLIQRVSGGFAAGPARTHLGQDSPFIASHHRNWRLKALERHPTLGADELAFSAPMTLAHADVAQVRQLLFELVQKVDALVRESPAETVACLNLDLIRI